MTTTVPIAVPAYITNLGFNNWWTPCGCNLADAVAAYAAKGAASYAASKINLANPGTYDLVEDVNIPNWSQLNGFEHSPTSYLSSYLPLLLDMTIIYKFSDNSIEESYSGCTIQDHGALLATYDIGEGGPWAVAYGMYHAVEPALTLGIICFTEKSGIEICGYRNGLLDYTGEVGVAINPSTIFIGNTLTSIYSQSCAVYNKVLTQSQIQEVGANMP